VLIAPDGTPGRISLENRLWARFTKSDQHSLSKMSHRIRKQQFVPRGEIAYGAARLAIRKRSPDPEHFDWYVPRAGGLHQGGGRG